MKEFGKAKGDDFTKITVSTAHPAKFKDDVERIVRDPVPIPPALQYYVDAPSKKHILKPSLEELAAYLFANV